MLTLTAVDIGNDHNRQSKRPERPAWRSSKALDRQEAAVQPPGDDLSDRARKTPIGVSQFPDYGASSSSAAIVLISTHCGSCVVDWSPFRPRPFCSQKSLRSLKPEPAVLPECDVMPLYE